MRFPNYIKRIFAIILLCVCSYLLGADVFNILSDVEPKGVTGDIIGGIATSIVIFFFLLLFRPIIEISPKIACTTKADGSIAYVVKIYNSGFLPVHDIRASLTKVTYLKGHKGKYHSKLEGIPITFSYLEYLPSVCNVKAHKQGGEFAVQFRILPNETDGEIIYENVEAVLSDQEVTTHYRLTISCQSGFSGIRIIKTENYTYKSSIVRGEFKSGATFVIL